MKINRNAWWHGIMCGGAIALGSVTTAPLTPSRVVGNEYEAGFEPHLDLSTESQLNSAIWGRFGGLLADFAWIKVYRAWARKDLPELRVSLKRVRALNPHGVGFWLNGARMLGYDATAWRQREAGKEFESSIRLEQLSEAILFLGDGRILNPGRYEFGLEEAVLRMRLAGDLSGAVAELESIEEMPNLPYFVGRVRGELLVRLGRKEEALAWLRNFEQTLPRADLDAQHEVVTQRIRDLERSIEGLE